MLNKKKLTYISEDIEESGVLVQRLKKKLKECQKEKEEYLTQAQRARADLINYRRRQEQAIEELKNYGQADFIRELLPILDSLEIGAKENKGIKQIKEQLEGILKKYGLKEISAVGEKFNPQFHEAIDQVESKEEEGTIIKEVQKGYMLGDKILRPSKVRVAK
jgi:molecular chaperone GrpE